MWETGEWAEIGDTQNRSMTFAALAALDDHRIGTAERREIGATLGRLGDPRAVAPLTRIALHRARPAGTRQAALTALEDAGLCPEGDALREWWHSGDDMVRAVVLRQAGREHADLLGTVSRDPRHPLHRHAIDGLAFGFEEPHWQRDKIRGSAHADPAVRRVAAEVLRWDEPVAAEPALHRAAHDGDPAVAVAAIETLRYYRSRATLLLLDEIGHGTDERAAAARESVADLRCDFEDAPRAVRPWLAPVAHLLRAPEPAGRPSPASPASSAGRPVPAPPPATELVARYADPDGAWAPKLAALHGWDWSGVPAADRPVLARFFAGHPDPRVRAPICRALAAWRHADALLALAHDADSTVRKSAVYYLRFVPRSPDVATLTWDLVASGAVAGVGGYEALATCAAHTPPGALDDRLIGLARSDPRESVRAEAVSLLGDRVAPVLPLLAEEPLVTWDVHVRLLDACAATGLRPRGAEALRGIDHLDPAVALAAVDANG
ncbi:HEAT repeat domain-containing protein [Nocardia thailandica]